MGSRRLALIFSAMLAAACTSEAPRQKPQPAAVKDLPRECSGFETSPSLPLVTFTVGGSIYASAPDGSGAHCLFENKTSEPLAWAPSASGLLLGDGEVSASGSVVPPAADVENLTWSRPTGKSLIWIADDGAALKKRSGGREIDISFLGRHQEAIYHPAGMHIAAVGELDEENGIYLASNTGANPQPLAQGESARRLHGLSYANDGRLFFAADHGDRQEVHAIDGGGKLLTIESGHEEFGAVTASPFSRPVAYRKGSCGGRTTVRVWNGSAPTGLGAGFEGRSTEPAGWLPDGRLLVLARGRGCSGPADLYVWSSSSRPSLLARKVSRAAVRATLPPPPPPPRAADQAPA